MLRDFAAGLWIACVLVSAARGQEQVAVKALRIREYRGPSNNKDVPPSVLTLTLELSGPPIARTTKFGHITLKTAQLDDGAQLKLVANELAEEAPPLDPTKALIPADGFRYGKAWDKLLVDLHFLAPVRGAASLVTLDGTMKLQVAEGIAVKLNGLVGRNSTVRNDTIDEAGLTVASFKLTKVQVPDPSTGMRVQILGDPDKVLDLWLIDVQGRKIPLEYTTDRNGKTTSVQLVSAQPLPEDAVLVLEIASRLDLVDVPLKLSKIKLP